MSRDPERTYLTCVICSSADNGHKGIKILADVDKRGNLTKDFVFMKSATVRHGTCKAHSKVSLDSR